MLENVFKSLESLHRLSTTQKYQNILAQLETGTKLLKTDLLKTSVPMWTILVSLYHLKSDHQYRACFNPLTAVHQYCACFNPLTAVHQYCACFNPLTTVHQYCACFNPHRCTPILCLF